MKKLILFGLLSVLAFAQLNAKGLVVSSIKPLDSIVINLIQGTDIRNKIIVDGQSEMHDYNLKPNDIANLKKADIIFMISSNFETYLKKYAKANNMIEITQTPYIKLLPIRPTAFDMQMSAESHANMDMTSMMHMSHDKGAMKKDAKQSKTPQWDYHIWLNKENTLTIAENMAKILREKFPENSAIIADNLQKFTDKFNKYYESINAKLIQKDIFVVAYHDAYQYFELQFPTIKNYGALANEPEAPISLKRFHEFKNHFDKIGCILTEPEVNDKTRNILNKVAKIIDVNPEAINLISNGELIFTIHNETAISYSRCIKS